MVIETYTKHSIQQQPNTYFPSTCVTFSRIDHILGHKTSSRRQKLY